MMTSIWSLSSNVNEVIRAVLNSLIFFTKSRKMYQKHQKHKKHEDARQKHKKANDRLFSP